MGQARAAVSALDAAGIECFLADENVIAIDWAVSQAVGGVKVLVRPEDLSDAQELLSTVIATEVDRPGWLGGPAVATPGGAAAPQARCPQCGSPDLRTIRRVRIFFAIAVGFGALGIMAGQLALAMTGLIAVAAGVAWMSRHQCNGCGHRFNAPRERVDAPPPDVRDTIEERCPRCGSAEVYQINQRRLKAIPLLFNASIFIVAPLWLASPKRQCESCGLKIR